MGDAIKAHVDERVVSDKETIYMKELKRKLT